MENIAYPGDNLISNPNVGTIHSILIKASAEDIWSWVVQVGYHRGGWYIDTWWDKFKEKYFLFSPPLVPKDERDRYKPAATDIFPKYQTLTVGNTIPDDPPDPAFYTVKSLEPNQHLTIYTTRHTKYKTPGFMKGTKIEVKGEFSWAFILDELENDSTKLTIRMRSNYGPAFFRWISKPGLIAIDYVYIKDMLKGIKWRAEGKK